MKHDEMTSATKGLEEDLGAKIKERNEVSTFDQAHSFMIIVLAVADKDLGQ